MTRLMMKDSTLPRSADDAVADVGSRLLPKIVSIWNSVLNFDRVVETSLG